MIKLNLKPLVIAASLSVITVNSWAQLNSNKLAVNSIIGDRVAATVSFPAPVSGDLYLATEFGGQLYFLGQGDALSIAPAPFQANGKFSAAITVLDMPSAGIPAGNYPLFQVVTFSGSDPLNFSNWIGGAGGLSQIVFSINMANTIPTPTPTPVPVSDVAQGKALYGSLGCPSCHGGNPASNDRNVLYGNTLQKIKASVNSGSMRGYYTATSDQNLQAVADYLNTL